MLQPETPSYWPSEDSRQKQVQGHVVYLGCLISRGQLASALLIWILHLPYLFGLLDLSRAAGSLEGSLIDLSMAA